LNGNADWLLNRYAAAIVASSAYFARTLEVIEAMTLDDLELIPASDELRAEWRVPEHQQHQRSEFDAMRASIAKARTRIVAVW